MKNTRKIFAITCWIGQPIPLFVMIFNFIKGVFNRLLCWQSIKNQRKNNYAHQCRHLHLRRFRGEEFLAKETNDKALKKDKLQK